MSLRVEKVIVEAGWISCQDLQTSLTTDPQARCPTIWDTMQKLFIEAPGFTVEVQKSWDDETYASFQKMLLAEPDRGMVIPGCGGLRKVRFRDPRRGKGKRGGARVIYLHVPEVNWIFLLDIYGKPEKDDLSAAEKKILRLLAMEFKQQARRAAGIAKRRRGEKD